MLNTSQTAVASPEAEREWGALMQASQSGDAAAYRALLGQIQPWAMRYYRYRLPPAMVDDAVQELLLALHEKRHTYDPSRLFKPWLAAIARYKWIDRLRAMKVSSTEALSEEIAVSDHEEAVTSAHALERLLALLKPSQSLVIRLVKLEGLTVEEAAARSGQSASLVKVNIHRGLGRLGALVRSHSDDE